MRTNAIECYNITFYRAIPAVLARPLTRLAEPQYHAADTVRRVHQDGATSFQGRRVKLSQAFAGLDVAFRPTATDGVWRVFFARFLMAEVDLGDQETNMATVRHVSERTSGLTPGLNNTPGHCRE